MATDAADAPRPARIWARQAAEGVPDHGRFPFEQPDDLLDVIGPPAPTVLWAEGLRGVDWASSTVLGVVGPAGRQGWHNRPPRNSRRQRFPTCWAAATNPVDEGHRCLPPSGFGLIDFVLLVVGDIGHDGPRLCQPLGEDEAELSRHHHPIMGSRTYRSPRLQQRTGQTGDAKTPFGRHARPCRYVRVPWPPLDVCPASAPPNHAGAPAGDRRARPPVPENWGGEPPWAPPWASGVTLDPAGVYRGLHRGRHRGRPSTATRFIGPRIGHRPSPSIGHASARAGPRQ